MPQVSRSAKSRQSAYELDITKLLELGVSPKFVSTLDPIQARDLVKGVVYLSEKYLSDF